MANKMTQRDYFNEIKAMAVENGRDDIVEFVEGRLAALDKKSANRKPSKTQEENEVLKGVIVEVLGDKTMTVSQILAGSDKFAGMSNQKITALVTAMVKADVLTKSKEGKSTVFSVKVAE